MSQSSVKGCPQGCEFPGIFLLTLLADKVISGSLSGAFNREMQVLDPGSESSQELTRKWQKDQR